MTSRSTPRRTHTRWIPGLAIPLAMTFGAFGAAVPAGAQGGGADPRVGLSGGHWVEAGQAISNLTLDAHRDRPKGFSNPNDMGDFDYANSDLAFRDNYVFQGNFHGLQIWDVSDASNPTLKTTMVCPGGQGDPSVYKNLMFISVEAINGRIDCGTQGPRDSVSPERFRGVRIFDITDIEHPRPITTVQTCRGSHTHTLLPDPKDPGTLYVYVQGTAPVRPSAELAGCSSLRPEQDPNTSLFRIEIIRVPLAHPEEAKVVNGPRIFAANGQINGLAKEVKDVQHPNEDNDPMSHTRAETDQCHDITVFPAVGLAAGACSGNGILLDISEPGTPKRIAEVSDANFAYWHSATFNNNGTKVVFTDEWGGGVAPKCQASDPKNWGADAIFNVTPDHKLQFGGYYKLPAPQTETENCVAHNGSLVPVPGRDIMVQGWYQGGLSVFDFTDAAHPVEIAYFDRGPLDDHRLYLAGFWSAYWYDGHIYGSEIARGLDVLELKPSQYLTQNEIDAAKLVHLETSNPSDQQHLSWPVAFVVARAYIDQLNRGQGLASDRLTQISADLDKAEHMEGGAQRSALQKLAKQVDADAKGASDAARVKMLADEIRQLGAKKA